MNRKNCLLAILCFYYIAITNAQSIGIGQSCPDVKFSKILNYPVFTSNISSFKGKWLLLDFWSTWCSSCIYAMPKMDSLQKRFGEKIAIVTVTSEKASRIEPFMKSNRFMATSRLPSVVEDSTLHELFPHITVPHVVWIDPTGTVRAITSSYQVTGDNISKMIDNWYAMLPVKKDVLDFDISKPLLEDGNGGTGIPYLYRSLLTPMIPGLAGDVGRPNAEKHPNRFIGTNSSIPALYSLAFPQLITLAPKRVFLETSNPSRFRYSKQDGDVDNWSTHNLYCYELMLPDSFHGNPHLLIKEELDRFFNTNGRMEKRRSKCLVIISGRSPEFISPGSPESASELVLNLNRSTTKELAAALDALPQWMEVLDESGCRENISIHTTIQEGNISKLRQLLASYGLDLIETFRDVEVFVLSENKPQQ
jgi:thiol-disulfide isomerase/thioredoxin